MKFKKVYIEITNRCNLNCDFCIKNQRKIKDMTIEEYKIIINKIKDYTKEIYLHIMGEPLLHKDILKFIEYANSNKLLVNITTNGYLIDKIKDSKHIHRLNISLHSFNDKYKVPLNVYLDKIFTVIDNLKDHTFISLRLWIKDKNTINILKYINKRYNMNITLNNNEKIKISNNLIIDTFHEFIWPDMANSYYNESGKCYGLINHFGILVDGRVVPCCLDSKGLINLGNIFTEEVPQILEKKIVKDIQNGFRNNKKCHELCRHCSFLGD